MAAGDDVGEDPGEADEFLVAGFGEDGDGEGNFGEGVEQGFVLNE